MKTQINTLVQGSETLVGTPSEIRESVADKVHFENKTNLLIKIKGFTVELRREESLSGKTISYCGEINDEEYLKITGGENPYKKTHSHTLFISSAMRVKLISFVKKGKFTSWEKKKTVRIPESSIEILEPSKERLLSGEVIDALRAKAVQVFGEGWQKQLAEKIGVRPNHLSRVFNKKINPTLELFLKIAKGVQWDILKSERK